jgi:hypothetical protein
MNGQVLKIIENRLKYSWFLFHLLPNDETRFVMLVGVHADLGVHPLFGSPGLLLAENTGRLKNYLSHAESNFTKRTPEDSSV